MKCVYNQCISISPSPEFPPNILATNLFGGPSRAKQLSNDMTFDLDIWQAGNHDSIVAQVKGQNHGSKFTSLILNMSFF